MSTRTPIILRPVFSLLLLLLTSALPLAALEVPPRPTQWVTDGAGLLGGTAVDLLNRKLEQFEKDSGAQFIIYTLPSIENEVIEDFTIRSVESWKVGQAKYDNGLVIFVFAKEQKVRVEVGYGLEGTITDAFSSRVIREYMGPHFQKGDYAAGLGSAADAIIARIKKTEPPVPPAQRGGQAAASEGSGIVPALVVLFVVFFVLLPMFRRRGGGGGGGCLLPILAGLSGTTFRGGGFGGGFGGGGGGFSGGGGSFGGGGATGGW